MLKFMKGTRVSETQEFRQRYTKLKGDRSLLSFVKIPIIYFRGQSQEPRWMDVEPGKSRSGLSEHHLSKGFSTISAALHCTRGYFKDRQESSPNAWLERDVLPLGH
jgi:hypothetical protein